MLVPVDPSENKELTSCSFTVGVCIPVDIFLFPWNDARRFEADDFRRIPGRGVAEFWPSITV